MGANDLGMKCRHLTPTYLSTEKTVVDALNADTRNYRLYFITCVSSRFLKTNDMKPKEILHEEQKKFFAKQKEYEEKHSERDDDLHQVFKSDYLSSEKLDKWFVQEFATQEPQWDLKTMIDDDDYFDLVQRINDGYSMSGFVLAHVDSITDKYYRDGCH